VPHALIVGAFGQDNPGDEALLGATVDAVAAAPGWVPVVATARPGETSDALGIDTIPASAYAVGKAATHADALVVGGGTVFKELHPATGRRRVALLAQAVTLARAVGIRGKPVALVGVGAAPMSSRVARRMARELARLSNLLVLRDDESAAILIGAGVSGPLRVGADMTWSGAVPTVLPVGRGAPVGVAVSHLAADDDFIDRLGEALGSASLQCPVELEPWQGSPRLGSDALVARRLAAGAEAGSDVGILSPPDDFDDAVVRASGRRAMVALRFHGAVAAACGGRPFLAVTHEPKLSALAARLAQPTVSPSASTREIAAALSELLHAAAPSRAAVDRERARALATADLLQLLLAGRGPSSRLGDLDLVPAPVAAALSTTA